MTAPAPLAAPPDATDMAHYTTPGDPDPDFTLCGLDARTLPWVAGRPEICPVCRVAWELIRAGGGS